jgi:bifunctional DNase/RNase
MQLHYTVTNLTHAKSLKQLSFVSALLNRRIMFNYYTVYLVCHEEKIILPVNASEENIKPILASAPAETYSLIKQITELLKAKVFGVVILEYVDEIFYAYLRIEYDGEFFDIHANFYDALCFAVTNNLKIYITEKILLENGTKITKDLIERSLASSQ